MGSYTPAQTGYSRVFITENGAGPENQPEYQSCLKAGGIDKSFGDITKIECPSPDRYNEFDEVGEISGTDERMTTTLTGRYALNLGSELMRLANKKCSVDVVVNLGTCSDPSDYNAATKTIYMEDVRITSYSTEDLGALGSDERAKIDESVDISVKNFYEVLQMSFTKKADSIITNELVDGVVCDSVSCGDCGTRSAGCERAYFVSIAAGGSPGTPADVIFTIDKGDNWYAHDVDSLGAAENPTGIACVGSYMVVVSNDSNSLHYATKSEITPINDEVWTEITTGFVTGGEPNDIWSTGNYAFIVGDTGYVYGTSDPTGGVTVLDAGVATSFQLNAVHALSSDFAVAVGNSGTIIKTENGTSWTVVTPTNVLFVQDWQAVWVKSSTEWWICGATGGVGQVWYTLDGGSTWYRKTNIPGTYTAFYDIQFSSNAVAYLTGTIAGPRGRILKSKDGGYSWQVLPEGTGTMPLSDRFSALATCEDDVNLVFAGGLADNGADGILVVGQD